MEVFRDQDPYDKAFATWHPGSIGHRKMAEIVAFEYLTALELVLESKK
jgi:hypothetical protein